ncbi:MAG: FxsA family protein [bacterium]
MRLFFALFLAVPLVEIYLLIQVGGVVGAGLTIVLVVATALLGAALVRAQGFSTWARVQSQLARGEVPAMEMFEGMVLFVAGALLLTPGFFTDAIGFACLVPPLRRRLIARAIVAGAGRGRIFRASPSRRSGDDARGRVIDVEHKDLD